MAAGSDASVLAVHDLSCHFGRVWALRHVDLAFEAGQITALRGDNGAGKSTLLKVCAGLIKPREGTVSVFGEHFQGFFPSDIREKMAVLGHAPFVYPDLTGLENLHFFRKLYRVPLDTAADGALLERLGLWEARDKQVRHYSRGMTQRLALGRILLQDAPIWLLDEPSTGLDAPGMQLLQSILAEAREQRRCVVAITHDMEALGEVDRVIWLRRGRLVS